jgi:hypothetical protein
MFEGQYRLYIGDFSDPSTTAERKRMIPDYPTIEAFYRGRAVSGIVAAPKRHFWPISAAPVVCLRVRYRAQSCRARSLTRRRVRREVADIEHRPETACGWLGMALYLSLEDEGLRHIWRGNMFSPNRLAVVFAVGLSAAFASQALGGSS